MICLGHWAVCFRIDKCLFESSKSTHVYCPSIHKMSGSEALLCCSSAAVYGPHWCRVPLLFSPIWFTTPSVVAAAAATAAMSPSLLLLHSSATPCRGLLPPPSSCFATFSRASSPLRPRHRIRLVCAAEQPNGAASPGSGSGGDATANPTNNGLVRMAFLLCRYSASIYILI